VGHVVHRVKEHPRYFEDLIRFPRPRPWELRDNNRDFKTGDGLRVVEWDPSTEKETGRWALCRISWTSEEHARVHLMPQGLILLGVEVLQLVDARPIEVQLEHLHDSIASLEAGRDPGPPVPFEALGDTAPRCCCGHLASRHVDDPRSICALAPTGSCNCNGYTPEGVSP